MQISKLHQVAAKADDLEKSIAFYQQILGAKLIAYFEQPGLAFFDLDGTRLLLEQNASPATLYFSIADIQGAYEELTAKGVNFMGPPHIIHTDDSGLFGSSGHNEWMCFFNDPSGNVLALACQQAPIDTRRAWMTDLMSLVNEDPALSRRGMGYNAEFELINGDNKYLFEIYNGKLTGVLKNESRGPVNGFTLNGPESSWSKFCQATPPPEFHDIFAMISNGHITLAGNNDLLMSNILYVTGFLAHFRNLMFQEEVV